MVNDTEPRYRLVDGNGKVVGSLHAEADGTLKLQEGTSGSDNEVSVATDGTFNAPAVSTGEETLTKNVVRLHTDRGESYTDYPIADYTDIGSAINTALSDLSSRGTVELPAGKHTVKNRIKPTDLSAIKGQGRFATSLVATDGLDDDIIGEDDASTGNVNAFEMHHLSIDGNAANQTATSHGIYAAFASVRINNIDVRHTNGRCVWLASSGDGSNTDNNKIDQCRVKNPASGFEALKIGQRKSGNESVGAVTITNTDISDSDTSLVIAFGDGIEIHGCRLFSGGEGIRLDRCEDSEIAANLIQPGSTGDGILIIANAGRDAAGVKAHHNTIRGQFGSAFRLNPKNSGDDLIGVIIDHNNIDEGGFGADYGIESFGSGAIKDSVIENNIYRGAVAPYQLGTSETRLRINGWGENAGDPNSTGAWNGNGREGIGVVDTTNNVKYVYRDGAWV